MEPVGTWAGLLLQGGAFGLLAYIVIVMYPRAAKDAREERDKRDTNFITMATIMQDKFADRNQVLAATLKEVTKEQTLALTRSLEDQSRQMTTTIAAQSDVISRSLAEAAVERGTAVQQLTEAVDKACHFKSP